MNTVCVIWPGLLWYTWDQLKIEQAEGTHHSWCRTQSRRWRRESWWHGTEERKTWVHPQLPACRCYSRLQEWSWAGAHCSRRSAETHSSGGETGTEGQHHGGDSRTRRWTRRRKSAMRSMQQVNERMCVDNGIIALLKSSILWESSHMIILWTHHLNNVITLILPDIMTSAIQHTLSKAHSYFKSSPGSAHGSSLIGSYLTEGAGHGRVHVHADERVFSIRRQIGVVCWGDIRDDHIHTLLLPFSVGVILLSLLKIRGMQGERTVGQEWLGHFLNVSLQNNLWISTSGTLQKKRLFFIEILQFSTSTYLSFSC